MDKKAIDVAYDIMIPRSKIVWIEKDAKHEDVWVMIMGSTQGVFSIYQGRRENLVGAVLIKNIYGQLAAGESVSFPAIMHPPLLAPETQKASVLQLNPAKQPLGGGVRILPGRFQ